MNPVVEEIIDHLQKPCMIITKNDIKDVFDLKKGDLNQILLVSYNRYSIMKCVRETIAHDILEMIRKADMYLLMRLYIKISSIKRSKFS